MQSSEFELTFLVKDVPFEVLGAIPHLVKDVYVPEEGISNLRIRKKDDVCELTKKMSVVSGDYSMMRELTIPLEETEYESLILKRTRQLMKHRYSVVIDGYHAEVDVFQKDLLGLVLIDFEFESKEQKDQFKIPNICLADVTQESFISGANLAGKSYEDIAEKLSEYKYVPVFLF